MYSALLVSVSVLLAASADPPSAIQVVAAVESSIIEAIEKAEGSVVAISREKSSEGGGDRTVAVRGDTEQPPLPRDRFDPLRGGGEDVSFDYASGVVIGPKNAILTTFHAVRGAYRIKVRAPGKQFFEAEIIAADPRSDLAVIVPRPNPDSKPPTLKPMTFGDSSTLRKGAFLLALGNPFNSARDGSPSAAWGILSNIQRRIDAPIEERNFRLLQNFPTLLQLDTKLNVGMSGGAVINLKGELVGITTASANVAGFDAMAGYAIPIDSLTTRVINLLREGREAEYGFLGISLDLMGSNRVKETQPGSPAGEGGVLNNDAILMVGNRPVTDSETLVLAVNAQPVGKPVVLKLERAQQMIEKTVVLSKYPVIGGIATNRPAPWRGIRVDYSSVLSLGQFGQPSMEVMAKGGVAVVDIINGSVADLANLKRGLLILRVENKPTKTPEQFAKAVEGLTGRVVLHTDQGDFTLDPPASQP